MYTAEQAIERLNAKARDFEEYIDGYLTHFDGKALKIEVNLDVFTENTINIGIEQYQKAGWMVSTDLPCGYITFDLPRPYGTGVEYTGDNRRW